MQVYSEEIKLKMGLDSSGVAQELRKVNREVANAGGSSHKSFIHASNGAKEFKKIINDIKHDSPLLGLALKAAFSPLGVVFAGAGLALNYFTDKLEKQKEMFDHFGEFAAKPISNVRDMLRETAKEIRDLNAEFDKWLKSHEQGAGSKVTKGLEDQLSVMRLQAKEIEKRTGKPMEKKTAQAEFAAQREALRSLSEQLIKAGQTVDEIKSVKERRAGFRTAKEGEAANAAEAALQTELGSQLKSKKSEADISITEATIKTLRNMVGIGPSGEEAGKDVVAEIEDLEAGIKASKKRVQENNDAMERESAARKVVADKLTEAQSKFDELKAARDSIAQALEGTRQQLSVMPPSAPWVDTKRFDPHGNFMKLGPESKSEDLLRSIETEMKELNRKAAREGLNMVPKLPD